LLEVIIAFVDVFKNPVVEIVILEESRFPFYAFGTTKELRVEGVELHYEIFIS